MAWLASPARLSTTFVSTTEPEHSMSAAPSFHWQDPLLLDTQLTEEERMVRDAAQAYAQDKLATRVLEAFRHEKTNPAIFSEMGELGRSEEHTSELQSLMRISYAVFCLKKKNKLRQYDTKE